MTSALVVGGTGPTGPFVVNGLIERGFDVTIMHTGRHEQPEIPPQVAHIHTNPFDREAASAALGSATYDLGVVMYGRLRMLAPLLVDRVGRLITVGGVGAVKGWVDPEDLFPTSMTVPTPEEAPLADRDEPIGKIRRIVETEQAVFEHHPGATHLRYPMLYGPRQLIPREWPLIRRALDRRPTLILPDGGLTLKSAAYVENAAHALLCATDDPVACAGRIYNVTDTRALTLRQIAELVADELGHQFEFVSMPNELAVSARPVVMHWSSGHRVVSTAALQRDLGYRDVVEPEDGIRRTVRWLVDHPPTSGAEALLQDPFDYQAEDELVARWHTMLEGLELPPFQEEPGYGAAYYGRRAEPGDGHEPGRTGALMVAPLSGVRIVEVANMIAAPGAAAIMADLGASVIKVEPRRGDILRELVLGPGVGPDPWFELDNRGKRGLAIELDDQRGTEVVHQLASTADVFLTNLTRERQERFRLTAGEIHQVAPSVIHTSLTGYGTTGPEADRLAYDMTAFFARGGIQSLVREPGGPPAAFRPGQGDHTSSLAILAAVLAALRLRDQTGEGQVVEVALMQVAAWTIASDLSATLVTGADPELHHRERWPSAMTCRFRCRDDRWLAFCMPGPKDFFPAFAQGLGHPEWIDDDRFLTPESRREHSADLVALCDETFDSADRDTWADRLDEAGLTWAPIQSPTELANDPQADALGVLHLVADHPDGAFHTVNAPFAIRDADVGVRGRAPTLGEHSREILQEAGFDTARIDGLVADGIVAESAPDRTA